MKIDRNENYVYKNQNDLGVGNKEMTLIVQIYTLPMLLTALEGGVKVGFLKKLSALAEDFPPVVRAFLSKALFQPL